MKKTTLVSSSIIAASLFGATLIAPPMNVNPLQPQVVQADTQDDLALQSAIDKLNNGLLNSVTYDCSDFVSSYSTTIGAILSTFSSVQNSAFLSSNSSGSLKLLPSNPLQPDIFEYQANYSGIEDTITKKIKLDKLEQTALINEHPTFTTSLKFFNADGTSSEYNNAFDDPNFNFNCINTTVNEFGGYLLLQYDIKLDNGTHIKPSATIRFDPKFKINIPKTKLDVDAGDSIKDFEDPDITKLGIKGGNDDKDNNNLTFLLNKQNFTALGNITDDKDNSITESQFIEGKKYKQKITIKLGPQYGILAPGQEYESVLSNNNLTVNQEPINESSKGDNYLYDEDKDNKGILVITRTFTVKPKDLATMNININEQNIDDANVGDEVSKYTDLNNIGINPDSIIDKISKTGAITSNIITGPDKKKDEIKDKFKQSGKYKQTINLNLKKLYGNNYSTAITNGKLTINNNKIDPKKIINDNYEYSRDITVKPVSPTVQPLEFSVAVPKDIFEKVGNSTSPYTNKNDFKITVMSGKEKDTDIANNASVSLIKENGVAADQTFTEGTYYQELKIDLKKLFGTNYDDMFNGTNLSINGTFLNNSNEEYKNGFFIVKRKITVPKKLTITDNSQLGPYKENADTKDTQDQIKNEISNSISAKGYTINSSAIKLGDIFYNNSTRPYDKGTLDTGEYDQIVKINLKNIFSDDYIAAALNVRFNDKPIEKQDLDTDGWFQYKKHFTVGKTNPSQPPVNPKPTQPVNPSPAPQPTAPAVVTPTQPTPDNKPAVTDEDLNGVVTILNGSSFQYAQIFDDNGNVVVDRYLALNSAWKTDRRRLINGTYYYRVSTHEYVRLDQVIYTDTPTKSTWIDTGITRSDMAANVFQVTEPQAYLWEISTDGQRLNQKPDRLLVTGSSWKTGQKLVIDGATFYQVSTNEWVKETKGYLVK
ncbi:hypothetical protein DS832_00360 [Bombilactobacillus bombi]|uniref:Surface layer protein A domain-containing protein n=1 Tax=Bombilactobacillus bombi TaxID=1303590 RepID=A0A3R6V809_9LACO|nr:SLAP domain-containing protein [Bombilactobacillus bombi]RHW48736.1 hypothetical protein DS832_00360 [Bombilactobacillus bombi]